MIFFFVVVVVVRVDQAGWKQQRRMSRKRPRSSIKVKVGRLHKVGRLQLPSSDVLSTKCVLCTVKSGQVDRPVNIIGTPSG